jgi:uncharacterized repeat protein (TIGR02543 family)
VSYEAGEQSSATGLPATGKDKLPGTYKLSAAKPKSPGYKFINWTLDDTEYEPGASYEVEDADITFTANWQQTYTVSYEAGKQSSATGLPAADRNKLPGTYKLPAANPKSPGYKFTNWTLDDTEYEPGASYEVEDADITFTANWQQVFTVSYKTGTSGGGVSGMPSNEKDKAAGSYAVPDTPPTRLNYTFDGWTMSPGDEKKDAGATYQIEDANVTFTAQWKPLATYTVTYSPGQGDGITGLPRQEKGKVSGSYRVPATKPKRPGYIFTDWTLGGKKYASNAAYNITDADITFTANWQQTYTVSYAAGEQSGSTGLPPVEPDKLPGSYNVSAAVPKSKGYKFTGWKVDSADYASGASYEIESADITFTAQWQKTYVVKFESGVTGGGVTGMPSPLTDNVPAGNYTLPAAKPARLNFKFDGWIINPGGSKKDEGTAYEVTNADITFTANWVDAPTYTVSYEATGTSGVTGLPGAETGKAPGSYIVSGKKPVRSGYKFTDWTMDGKNYASNAPYQITNANITFTANWQQVFNVSYEAGAQGGATGLPSGEQDKVAGFYNVSTAVPKCKGYKFTGWKVGSADYASGASYEIISEDITFTAQWQKTFNVIYEAGRYSGVIGLPRGEQNKVPGLYTVSTGRPSLSGGYVFTGWKAGSADYAPGANYEIIGADITFIAQWRQLKAYSVTYAPGASGVKDMPVPLTVSVAAGGTHTVATVPTRTGYIFDSWKQSNNNTLKKPGALIKNEEQVTAITLTAQWRIVKKKDAANKLTNNNPVLNKGDTPLVSYNFMLRVEGVFDLPCKSVKAFTKENEYEYIQEGGQNDYVHMRRKPISKPFTLEVERYVGIDYLDPLPNGAEPILPIVLGVSRDPGTGLWQRTYTFTGCIVVKKTYGELNAEKAGLLVDTTTIAYREMIVVDLPYGEV